MSTTETLPTEGDTIRFTARLGLFTTPDCRGYFADEVVNAGDQGDYVGPHPTLADEGWHVCAAEIDGDKFYAPVHRSHFEVVS